MRRNTIISWCAYVCYVLGVIAGADYLAYRFYLSRVMPVTDRMACDTVTGLAPATQKNGPFFFEKAKRAGVIRIGCFGDSFTRGAEVGDGYDYPALLQDIFRRNGYDNVEVINFGVDGSGFHQVFNTWKFFAQNYRLDYVVIFGNACFTYDRDSTFTQSTAPSLRESFCRLHARYVLKNGRVEMVTVNGTRREEQVRGYLSFIPRLRYLLYDRRPPAFLAAPVYLVSAGRELKGNPFYYRSDLDEEMKGIYKLLLGEMADKAAQVIFFHNRDELLALGRRLNKSNLSCFRMNMPYDFPYQAAFGHNSPNGNRFVAQQLFDFLTGEAESSLAVMRTVTIAGQPAGEQEAPSLKLSEYAAIGIELNGSLVGHFYDPQSGDWSKYCQGPECRLTVNALAHASSLVTFRDTDRSILNWPFLSLDFAIDEKVPVTMRFTQAGKTRQIPLGSVTLLRPGLQIGIVDIGPLFYQRTQEVFSFCAGGDLQRYVPAGAGEVTVLIKGIPVLSGAIRADRRNFRLYPVHGDVLVIRPGGNTVIDPPQTEPEGIFYLSLQPREPGPRIRVPLARLVKAEEKVVFAKPVARPVTKAGAASK
ncbi:MAG TPA: SGNH/GDSL hydrolase family protein [Patescibacteria group bacterium]|nr:SGNH/GDSL hydrolase family protein [Patescibacteria group bacterium]